MIFEQLYVLQTTRMWSPPVIEGYATTEKEAKQWVEEKDSPGKKAEYLELEELIRRMIEDAA